MRIFSSLPIALLTTSSLALASAHAPEELGPPFAPCTFARGYGAQFGVTIPGVAFSESGPSLSVLRGKINEVRLRLPWLPEGAIATARATLAAIGDNEGEVYAAGLKALVDARVDAFSMAAPKAAIRNLVDSVKPTEPKNGRINGGAIGWPRADARIVIESPADLAIFFVLMIHEVDHVINDAVSPSMTAGHFQIRHNNANDFLTWILYYQTLEFSAINSEWTGLNLIPEAIRARTTERLRILPGLHAEDRVWLISMFEDSRLPLADYIARQRATGRASLVSTLNEILLPLRARAAGRGSGASRVPNMNPSSFLTKPRPAALGPLTRRISETLLLTPEEKTLLTSRFEEWWHAQPYPDEDLPQ